MNVSGHSPAFQKNTQKENNHEDLERKNGRSKITTNDE